MRLLLLCVLPLVGGLVSGLLPGGRGRRVGVARLAVLVGVALVHTAVVASLWVAPEPPMLGGWLAADALGLIVLTLTSALFVLTAFYTVGYLQRETPRGGRFFVSAMLGFLAATTVVSLSQHLAMLWVGMEATTLAVAPLIYHRHDRRSLEAVWKYLLISSVGIALALLGTFFLASAQGDGAGRPLVLTDLIAHARMLHRAELLTDDEADSMLAALDDLDEAVDDGTFRPTVADEDVHTALERGLLERLGSLGGKLRAGRSRNDQVATDLRLFLRDHARLIWADM